MITDFNRQAHEFQNSQLAMCLDEIEQLIEYLPHTPNPVEMARDITVQLDASTPAPGG